MIIFKIYRTVFDTGNPANLTNPAIEPLDDYSIEIKDSRERVVVSTISPENDTHALFVPLSGQDVKCDCQQQGNMVILNPHFRYMDETSSIEVDIKNTDKRFTLLPYHAEFAFYGYDLELDIVLVDNDHAKYPFNHCKVYRKPFGSQVNVLNTVSSSVAERVYNITTESNSSTVAQSIKSTQNFAIYSNALEHNLSVTGSSSKFVKTGCKQNPVAANPDSTLITDSLGKIEAGKWLPEIELILKNYSLGGIYGKKCIYMELDFRGVISEKTKGEPHYLCENAGIVLSYVNANSALLQTKYFLRRFSSVEFTGKQMILIDSLPFSDTIAKEVRVEFLLFGREAPRITPPYYDGSAQVTGNHIVYQNRTYHTGEIVNFDKNSVIQYENNGSLQPVIWTECNKWYRHPVTNEIFLGIIHTKSIEITPQLRIVKTLEIKD